MRSVALQAQFVVQIILTTSSKRSGLRSSRPARSWRIQAELSVSRHTIQRRVKRFERLVEPEYDGDLFLEGSNIRFGEGLARTDEQLKNLRRLAGHLHQYRALSTPQHARQTPLLSVQSEGLQCAPTMAEGCTPKTEIRRGAKFNRLLNHSSGERKIRSRQVKIGPIWFVESASRTSTLVL